ncbi:MAG TPA: RagB/SusD family nutrient uptake outer membrane protein [Daejeonella sp.]|nr:RagB/SusD family nutrient uptake outer membrane protein [Daejeonella sp.]
MKKYYIILLLLACTYTSCKEQEFLKEEPKDNFYADNLFEKYEGFKLAVNGLLDFPRQERSEMIQSAELGVIWKIGTDNGWANTELSWTRGLSKYTEADLSPTMQFVNGDTEGRDGIFLILYKAIASANTIITRAQKPDVDWQGGSEAQNVINKNQILGHAHLVRAWAYRHLAYTFGDVPITTEEITGLNFRNDWDRNPVAEVQALVIADLTFAAANLPDVSNDVLVLSNAVANHYLADMYLWVNEPAKAEEAALKVTNNSNYSLITARYGANRTLPGNAFMDQFKAGNILRTQGNTEALWIFPNSDVLKLIGARGNAVRRTWVVNYSSFSPYSPENGGRGIGRAGITAWGLNNYEATDDRFSDHAIKRSYVSATGAVTLTQSTSAQMNINNNRWASTRKWDWVSLDPARWGDSYSFADQTYLRLADTYLLLAEAYFKQGKLTQAAEFINKVRTRSKATPIATDGSTITLDYILDERSRELVTEELRRETLIRTGKLLERARNPIYNKHTVNIKDYQVLLPIPQKVIDANTGKTMSQNPGYN